MEGNELKEMVAYYANMLQKGKIELLDQKLGGMKESEFQRGVRDLKEIKNLQDLLELKLIELEAPKKEYNMYCPYKLECELEGKYCESGNCKEFQWGK